MRSRLPRLANSRLIRLRSLMATAVSTALIVMYIASMCAMYTKIWKIWCCIRGAALMEPISSFPRNICIMAFTVLRTAMEKLS